MVSLYIFNFPFSPLQIFQTLAQVDGRISGAVAKDYMLQSKLPNNVLRKIWTLSDIDKNGYLDLNEFALANYLVDLKLNGCELPSELPDHLVPPSFRFRNEYNMLLNGHE